MKLPISWLLDYTNIDDITPKQYADALTMSGSKVEGIEEMGAEIQNVVAGKIIKKEKHPNADTLWICQVDVGDEVTQIITGAQNISEGDTIPVALHGAKLPGGVTIKSGKLRGEKSNGMMCSHEELGLEFSDVPGACEDGIIILQGDFKPGTDIKEVFGLSENIIEFEITSNRPDCLSVIGIARETAATFDREFKIPPIKEMGNSEKAEDYIKIRVDAPDLCPRYVAAVVKNAKIEQSPKWLRDRLTACGVRPINNIVDITNYVMLEYGQPMHAFDRNFLSGGEIIVRRAAEGEKITTLDDEDRELTSDMLVIADKEKAVAVAGVMGGENSEIHENTKEIVFESANFNGASVRMTAKKLGMRTEASARFEKGLDPNVSLVAVKRALELVELLGAGEVVGGFVDVFSGKKEKRVLPLEIERTNKFLGVDIDKDFYAKVLTALEFEVDMDKMEVKVPTFRNDIEGFADIAEEIARFYGYNNIPSTLLHGETTVGQRNFEQAVEEEIADALTLLGCYEVMTYSFTHPKSLSMINRPEELESCIKILNPLGVENSVMRNNMIHSLLEILAGNYNQRASSAKVFEIGKIYLAEKLPLQTIADEPKMLAVGGYGDMDFFDLKGIIEELFEILAVDNYSFEPESEDKTFHPGKTASIIIGNEKAGVIGEIHPGVLENYDIETEVYMAQISLEKIIKAINRQKQYKTLNRFPAVSRDIAMVVSDEVLAADVDKCIKKYGGKLLEEVKLFDVYKGKQIPEGKKSMAYSAVFRAPDRTLNEKEVNRVMEKILKMLGMELGAELR